MGNSDATVGNVKTVEVLWESFGTDEMPNVGDLVASASYKNGYIRFSIPENFREGNAVVAAKNSKGVILWSWHIWCCEEGWQEQVYFNDAGVMMDRNLGATSATPGHVGALGLLYQWGRKDPFLGSSSIREAIDAKSTGTWAINTKESSFVNLESNPMTFYTNMSQPDGSWASIKTIYDPCPAGWRVPDGGNNGVWSRALGLSSSFNQSSLFNSTDRGMNFSGKFGSANIIWYPTSGCRYNGGGTLGNVGNYGYYWSTSYHISGMFILKIDNNANVDPSTVYYQEYGHSVRCLQVID